MATHLTGLLLAGLVFWRALKQFGDAAPEAAPANPTPAQDSSPATPRRLIGTLPAMGLILAGLALAGVLAASQAILTPPAVYRSGEAQKTASAIDPRTVPMVGSPDARYVVNLLFDYKCPHCQQLHFMLSEVVRRYGGKLAFVLNPAPLCRQCNPYVERDVAQFKDSCELAKIALAVWVAKREVFPDFDRWMFSLDSGDLWHPRRLEAARAKAIEMVGQAKFEAALANPWIDQYLKSSVEIYGNNGANAIPKLVFGSRWVTPDPYDVDELIQILHASLAVPKP
jgi:protein-disulfide isomerase